ncbi:hypothetical protein PG985_004454 [Apiospora marii]|uniref:Exonuclease domain-containing protein n=1 Tax=Apiospora marii TaxID=335849 RepID=A0ABR1S9C7_9PEZI
MQIQSPFLSKPSEWPHKSGSLLRRTPLYQSACGNRFIHNKIWNCTLLREYASDCAFVGLDVEGNCAHTKGSVKQVGLVYLPEMPSTPIAADLLRGQRPSSLKHNLRSEVCFIDIQTEGEGQRDPKDRRRRCIWATQNLCMPAADVEAHVCELLSAWRRQSGKKYLVLVGFDMGIDLHAMAALFPAAATTGLLDGWVNAQDLARDATKYTGEEAIEERMQKEVDKHNIPTLATIAINLGITHVPLWYHNAGTDAILAVAVMIAAWDAHEQGVLLEFQGPEVGKSSRRRRKRRGKTDECGQAHTPTSNYLSLVFE